jgi:hypothetical protein
MGLLFHSTPPALAAATISKVAVKPAAPPGVPDERRRGAASYQLFATLAARSTFAVPTCPRGRRGRGTMLVYLMVGIVNLSVVCNAQGLGGAYTPLRPAKNIL